MTRPSASCAIALLLLETVLACQAPAQPAFGGGFASPTPFPAQHTKDVKWFTSLVEGIPEASRSGKPICLILAGQRPKGDC
jgi:hypothetical protein